MFYRTGLQDATLSAPRRRNRPGFFVAEIKAADTNDDGWITRMEANAQKRKLLGELLMGRR